MPAVAYALSVKLSAIGKAGVEKTRTGLIDDSRCRLSGPQGLKPASLLVLSGMAEAVPFPKPIYETSSRAGTGAPARPSRVQFCRLLAGSGRSLA
jgi:hypothetical protein